MNNQGEAPIPKGDKLATIEHLLATVQNSLDDDNALDVITIDLKGKSSLGDYMLIASGRSGRQVSAIADHLMKKIKDAGFGTAQIEGLRQADWVLIDTGDIIIHLFRPEVRKFYNLEKMWSPALTQDPDFAQIDVVDLETGS